MSRSYTDPNGQPVNLGLIVEGNEIFLNTDSKAQPTSYLTIVGISFTCFKVAGA